MTIIVHRGTHQIGGCATEIKTNTTRIIIDFGAELDADNARPLDIEGVTSGTPMCNAVLFSHYHGDHIGLMDTILPSIPLYMGEDAKQILTILNSKTKTFHNDFLGNILTFSGGNTFQIGDITITPFSVDHSAYDAYMFLIEAEGKRVLHTGDFRTHGFRGKGVKKVLEKLMKHVDVVICEGTTLNRTAAQPITENDIKIELNKLITENKYSFLICSSTNIDRIAALCAARPRGRYLLCDKYQKEVVDYISSTAGLKSDLYKCEGLCIYGANLDEKLRKQGFCMLVRAGNPSHKRIMDKFKDDDPLIIYSMWKGYLEEERVKAFIEGYRKVDVHTSGHADIEAIKMLMEMSTPDMIIPIHTEAPEAFDGIYNKAKVILLQDGEEFVM